MAQAGLKRAMWPPLAVILLILLSLPAECYSHGPPPPRGILSFICLKECFFFFFGDRAFLYFAPPSYALSVGIACVVVFSFKRPSASCRCVV